MLLNGSVQFSLQTLTLSFLCPNLTICFDSFNKNGLCYFWKSKISLASHLILRKKFNASIIKKQNNSLMLIVIIVMTWWRVVYLFIYLFIYLFTYLFLLFMPFYKGLGLIWDNCRICSAKIRSCLCGLAGYPRGG